jgi:hypothetical protein
MISYFPTFPHLKVVVNIACYRLHIEPVTTFLVPSPNSPALSVGETYKKS